MCIWNEGLYAVDFQYILVWQFSWQGALATYYSFAEADNLHVEKCVRMMVCCDTRQHVKCKEQQIIMSKEQQLIMMRHTLNVNCGPIKVRIMSDGFNQQEQLTEADIMHLYRCLRRKVISCLNSSDSLMMIILKHRMNYVCYMRVLIMYCIAHALQNTYSITRHLSECQKITPWNIRSGSISFSLRGLVFSLFPITMKS